MRGKLLKSILIARVSIRVITEPCSVQTVDKSYINHLPYGIIETVRQVVFMYRKKDKSKQTQIQMLCIEYMVPQ